MVPQGNSRLILKIFFRHHGRTSIVLKTIGKATNLLPILSPCRSERDLIDREAALLSAACPCFSFKCTLINYCYYASKLPTTYVKSLHLCFSSIIREFSLFFLKKINMNIFGSSAINYKSNSPYIVLCHVCAHYLRTHMHVWPFSAACRDLGPVCMPAYISVTKSVVRW